MWKRDLLRRPFSRKDRTSCPSPLKPISPLATSSSSAAQPASVVQKSHPEAETQRNLALELAFQKHFDDLPEADKDAFREASTQINEDNLLSSVKAYDDAHKENSSFRPRAKNVLKFLNLLNRWMVGVSTAIQANPHPAAIVVVGAVQIVISIAVEFASFFDRLTDMLDRFSDYLGPVAEYAKASHDLELIRQTVAGVYGDLLEFCRAAHHVFVDNKGARREWTSARTFLRVQWEPFEVTFADIEMRFKHHLDVLQHSAGALHLNTLRAEMQERRCMHMISQLNWHRSSYANDQRSESEGSIPRMDIKRRL